MEKIRNLCTESSFKRGLRYFEEGRVRDLEFFGDKITATVEGTRNYKITIYPDNDFKAICTCPYDWGGYCKHTVATLIALSKDYNRIKKMKNKEEDRINTLLNNLAMEELKDFLKAEFKKDPNLRTHFAIYFSGKGEEKSIHDYKKEISLLYKEAAGRYGLIGYGTEVNFSHIRDLAERYIQKRNLLEAAKIYQALSEVIAENMSMVDNSDGYYRGEFDDAINGLILCLKEAELRYKEKKRYINYLFNKYIENGPDYFKENYDYALQQICASKEDLTYWKELLSQFFPRALPDSDENWSEYYHAKELLMMQVFILDNLGEKKDLYELFQKYFREDHEFCLLFAERLEKDGEIDQAIEVAEEGLSLFSGHLTIELRRFLDKFYEKRCPDKYRENLKNLFFQEGEWSHYEKLKKLSSQQEWNEILQKIIKHFSDERKTFGESKLIDIYLKEEMFEEALKKVLATNNLYILKHYHQDLSGKYPKEYFNAYKELLIPFAESRMGRRHYQNIVAYLKKMKDIKGFEHEFREFVKILKERYANRPAFLDEMQRL